MFGISFLDFSSNDLFFLFNTVVFGNVSYQGTEYFDGKTKRYVDFPLTEILQMMGRAGRPQFDQHGKAVILVHEPKKSFYKKVKLNWNYLAFFGILCNNLPQKDHISSACSSCTNLSP